jgi:hypothetical protein
MKKLIFEDEKAIKVHKDTFQRTCDGYNRGIELLHKAQPFTRIETEAAAVEYLTAPVTTFDNIVILGTKTTRIPGLKIDAELVCKLHGIDRGGFLTAMKSIIWLPAWKKLFTWQGTGFIVNPEELEIDIDRLRTYAETEEQFAIVNHWQGLADFLTAHYAKGVIDRYDCMGIADRLGLAFDKNQFTPKYRNLAVEIKALNPA